MEAPRVRVEALAEMLTDVDLIVTGTAQEVAATTTEEADGLAPVPDLQTDTTDHAVTAVIAMIAEMIVAFVMLIVAEVAAQEAERIAEPAHHHSPRTSATREPYSFSNSQLACAPRNLPHSSRRLAQLKRLRLSRTESVADPRGMLKHSSYCEVKLLISLRRVGYVEFKNEESVAAAIQLTGQKLLGIPIIAQLTEAEKNRQVKTTEAASSNSNSIPFHRLYVGNIHFSITEADLQNVFEPFGELEFVQLQKEEQGRSRGYGFVQ